MRESVPQKVGSGSGANAIGLAQTELRSLIHRLADEVASFRARALAAEARQRELQEELLVLVQAAGSAAAPAEPELGLADAVALAERISVLELENAGLRDRLALAANRTSKLLERTRFLRQQQEQGEEVG